MVKIQLPHPLAVALHTVGSSTVGGCPTPLPPACVLPSLYPVFAAYIFTSFCICVFCICICVFVLVYLPGHCPLPIRYPLPPSLRTFSPIFYPLSSASPPKDQLRSDILRIYKISPHWTGSPWLKSPLKARLSIYFFGLKILSCSPGICPKDWYAFQNAESARTRKGLQKAFEHKLTYRTISNI